MIIFGHRDGVAKVSSGGTLCQKVWVRRNVGWVVGPLSNNGYWVIGCRDLKQGKLVNDLVPVKCFAISHWMDEPTAPKANRMDPQKCLVAPPRCAEDKPEFPIP